MFTPDSWTPPKGTGAAARPKSSTGACIGHRAGYDPSEPSRAEPSRAEPSRAEPSRAEPSRAIPASVRGDAVGRELHGSRAPCRDSHRDRRSRSLAGHARRAAGAALLAALAFVASPRDAWAQTLAITDLTLSPATVTEGDGRVSITVTATLENKAPRTAALYVAHSNLIIVGNADAADYSNGGSINSVFNMGPSSCGAANWLNDQCVRTLSFDVTDDDLVEPNEKLLVWFGTVSYNTQVNRYLFNASRTADLWIADNDAAAENAAPTVDTTTLSHPENEQFTGSSALLQATDGDDPPDPITGWQFEDGGPDNGLFWIYNDGQLGFRTVPDFENAHSADNDNDYQIKVRAVSGHGDREQSGPAKDVTVTVTDVNEPPEAVTNIRQTARTHNSLTMEWTAPTETDRPAVTGYDVAWKWDGVDDYPVGNMLSTTGTGTSLQISGLIAGSRYDVRVRAKKRRGRGRLDRARQCRPDHDRDCARRQRDGGRAFVPRPSTRTAGQRPSP